MPLLILSEYIEEEEKEKYNYIDLWDHYCIYKCIVQDVKNYSFILHGYKGPPFEEEWFWIVECKNGNIKNIKEKTYHALSSDSSYVDYIFIKNKNKIISAFTDKLYNEITFD